MTPRRVMIVGGLTSIAVATAWVLFVGLPRWYGRSSAGPAAAAPLAPAPPGRKIKASLFYVSDDGQRLMRVERDVPRSRAGPDHLSAVIHRAGEREAAAKGSEVDHPASGRP